MSDPIPGYASVSPASTPFMQITMYYLASSLIVVVLLIVAPFGTAAKKTIVDALPMGVIKWPLTIVLGFAAFVGTGAAWDVRQASF